MSKVLRFEFQVPNPEEAIEFYSNCFGWKFEKMPGTHDYWFILTGESDRPGIDGGLMKSPDGATRTTNSIEVSSVDDYLKIVVDNGGKVVVQKTAVPGMGYFAYCLDNQGLLFGVSEENTEA
ncbi:MULTISPECIES: VOC family protein [Bacillus]|uniref:Glyoxalase n=2 Tax=Bacillus TaxID=1386 RepID=A0A0M4FL63_9BACI|nr:MULTISPECIES: VOC family protein [Bacillus]ALC82691.1 glyoxalase [Bacillus gobiensis]MBP1081640.1 putative enzyme related to lactoylglutathione lyase [Bacillus capparidis]MED1096294.1 VOC family protein [Bacillus capparidis]